MKTNEWHPWRSSLHEFLLSQHGWIPFPKIFNGVDEMNECMKKGWNQTTIWRIYIYIYIKLLHTFFNLLIFFKRLKIMLNMKHYHFRAQGDNYIKSSICASSMAKFHSFKWLSQYYYYYYYYYSEPKPNSCSLFSKIHIKSSNKLNSKPTHQWCTMQDGWMISEQKTLFWLLSCPKLTTVVCLAMHFKPFAC